MKDHGEPAADQVLLAIDWAKQTDDFTMDRSPGQTTWGIYYLLSGEHCFFLKDRAYHIRKGDMVLIPLHALSKTTVTRKSPHERIVMNLREDAMESLLPEWAEQLADSFSRNPLLRLGQKEQMAVKGLIAKIQYEQESRQTGHEAYIRLLLSELLLTILRLTEGEPAEIVEYPSSLPYKVSEVAQYIGNHYAETLTLAQLSGQFHISPFYISRIFTQITGLSIISYINHVRVEEARRLLQDTDLSVTEIALQVGYQSVTHFGRVFKAAMGASPQRYRKNH